MKSVYAAAATILRSANPDDKVEAAHKLSRDWTRETLDFTPVKIDLPARPARPDAPQLVSPKMIKRHRVGAQKGRAALLHAIAHIEFNAIDLAADMIGRFASHPALSETERRKFIGDWVSVCDDEARHFSLIVTRLAELGMHYGDLPAHDGLWQAAQATSEDFIARLVIAPMVLEARGLDVTPPMIEKLKSAGDHDSAAIFQTIYDDEIGHVRIGTHWFHHMCEIKGLDSRLTFQEKVATYFKGLLKPPFNRAARDLAGMPVSYYDPQAFYDDSKPA
ncbi:MAG: ferritin-like domain-containing protein [Robiginitomaculum sp.]